MNDKYLDLTDVIAKLGEAGRMYSYDRPAYVFWNAVVNKLMKSFSFSEEEALTILRSKDARYMLDAYESMVERCAERMVTEYVTPETLRAMYKMVKEAE